MKRPTNLLCFFGFVVYVLGPVRTPAQSVLSIGPPQANPSAVFVSHPTTIKITAHVANPQSLDTPVYLLEGKLGKNSETRAGILYDDGTHGDETARDGIYTAELTLDEPAQTALYFRVYAKPDDSSSTIISDWVEVNAVDTLPPDAVSLADSTPKIAGQIYDKLLATGASPETAQAETIAWLSKQPQIAQTGASDQGGSGIWIYYRSGILGAMLLGPPGSLGGAAAAQSNLHPPAPDAALPNRNFRTNSTHLIASCKAIVLDPFEFQGIADSADLNRRLAGLCPFQPVHLSDKSANLDSFKNLAQYGIIDINSHGDTFFGGLQFPGTSLGYLFHDLNCVGTSSPDPSKCKLLDDQHRLRQGIIVIATGEELPAKPSPALQSDLQSAGVIVAYNHLTKRNYLAVTPQFIAQYDKGLPSSLVYVATCRSFFVDGRSGPQFGTANETLARAFIGNGAGTFFGYSEYVPEQTAESIGVELFEKLASTTETTGDAYTAVAGLSGQADQDSGTTGPAGLAIYGSDHLTLDLCEQCMVFTFPNGIPQDQVFSATLFPPNIPAVGPIRATNQKAGYTFRIPLDKYPDSVGSTLQTLVYSSGPLEYQLTIPNPYVFEVITPGVNFQSGQISLDYTFTGPGSVFDTFFVPDSAHP